MEPLTLALIMAGGAAVKGIGEGISDYSSAGGMMSDYEKEQMKKLQREQELGMLGFNSQEMSNIRQDVVNPIAALQRQQQDNMKATMAGMDAGSGSTFLQALVANEKAQEVQAAAENKIQVMNQAEKQRDEQLLMGLNRTAAAQEAAKRAAIVKAVTLGIGGAAESVAQGQLLSEEMAMGQAQIDADLELQQALLAAQGLIGGE
tara:strand:- start:108 stop:719 length:612 start_codon:yes stop_codon:yes gene_type:complete